MIVLVPSNAEENQQTAIALNRQLRYLENVVIKRMTFENFPAQTKEEFAMPQTMSMQDCARHLNIQSYRIQYAYAHNRLPEPRLRIGGRRVFTLKDLQQLAKHFGVTLPTVETAAVPAEEPVGV